MKLSGKSYLPSLVISHRGNNESADAPENTLEAFAGAWERLINAVEIDCRVTREGHVVLLHDSDSGRVGNRKVKVHTSTLSKLRDVEVIGRDRRYEGCGYRIPTLEEFCGAMPDRGIVYLEIKVGEEIFEPITEILDRYNLGPDRIRFIGFPDRPLEKLKSRFPAFDTYMLYGPSRVRPGGLRKVIDRALRGELDGIDLRVTGNFCESFADQIREAGLEAHCYLTDPGLYDLQTLRRVSSAGFLSITTDRPQTVRTAIKNP